MVMMKIHISGLRLSGEKGEVFFKKKPLLLLTNCLCMYFQFSQKKCKDKYNNKAIFKKVSYRKRFVKLFFKVLLYLPLDLVLESDRDLRRCPPEFSAEAPSNPQAPASVEPVSPYCPSATDSGTEPECLLCLDDFLLIFP